MSWQSFDDLASGWLVHALQASWQVALLIGAVWLVQRAAGKRLSPRWRHALWWLVALRLALPSLPTLPFAPVNWNAAERAVDTRVAEWAPRAAPFGLPRRVPDPGEPDAADPVATQPAVAPAEPTGLKWYAPDPASVQVSVDDPERVSPWLQRALFALWLLGVSWSAGVLLACERRFRRRLSGARDVDDPALLEELRQEARRCGLSHSPAACTLEGLPSPAVMGLFRGRLLLPVDFGRGLGTSTRRSILRHELFHLRHRDPWQELGLRLLGSLFWFHPLVHFAFAQLRGERESLRDWEALNVDRGLAPSQYAHTLLDLVARPALDDRDPHSLDAPPAQPTSPASVPLATGLLENAHDLPRRMQMITSFRPSNVRDLGLGGLALAGTAWLALASASTADLTTPEVAPDVTAGAQRVELRMRRIDFVPTWKQELYRQLEAPTGVSVDLDQHGAAELGTLLEGVLGLPVLTDPNDIDLDDLEVEYRAHSGPSKRAFLNGFCESANLDLSWSVNFGAILIGTADHVPQDLGQYVLDATALEDAGFYLDDLVELIPEYATGWSPWEQAGTELSYMGSGQVLLCNTPEQAALVKEFCEDMIAGHSPRFDTARAQRAAHMAALDGKLSKGFAAGDSADHVLRGISDATGVPIRVEGELIDLGRNVAGSVSPLHLLGWMAHVDLMRLEVDERGAWIGDYGADSQPLWTHVLSIGELVEHLDEEQLLERLYQASGVDDLEDAAFGQVQHLILVRTSPSGHEALISLLEGLEEHLGL